MADDVPLASLSLTHVYYDPSDPVSYVCAWLALVPQALCIVYATLIWSSREVEVALMFTGQLACEAVNFALKRLIKEERPRRIHGKGYGMPSSHAQFVAFWALSVTLFLLVRHRPRGRRGSPAARTTVAAAAAAGSRERGGGKGSDKAGAGRGKGGGGGRKSKRLATPERDDTSPAAPPQNDGASDSSSVNTGGAVAATTTANTNHATAAAAAAAALVAARDRWQQAQSDLLEFYGLHSYPHRPWSLPERAAVSLVAFVLAALVAWSRVYLGYHTPRQVLVGSLAGFVSALGWFAAEEAVRRLGVLAWAIDLPAARWFRFRDLVVEEDLCQAGWEKWEDRRSGSLVGDAAAGTTTTGGASAAAASAASAASGVSGMSAADEKTK